ncbi:MAG: hypothetical protein LUB63_06150, partial [Oscillospiraceae bacterium]|nr:hypothetical protein [Oscillospiraceae bacterium]
MKSCIKRTIPLLLALVMVVGLLTPFSEASAASKVINYNISSSAASSNATDGSLPTKASPVAGQPFYFNIQVSSDLKVKKFQLYVQDVGASKYSNVYTDTANNYFRYDSYKYTFKKTGTVKYYWKLTYTNGSTTTTSKTSVTVATFNQNVSSSKASKNASDGSLPTAASTIYTGSSYYFNFQVSSNLKVKKAQLYVMDVGASKY